MHRRRRVPSGRLISSVGTPHCLSVLFERFKWRLVTRVLGLPPHGGQRAVEEGSARIRADKRRLKAGTQFESIQAYSRHRSHPPPLDSSHRQFGGYGVGLTWESGPSRSLKLLVLSTWTPALCSPLKGVTVSGPPAFFASFGELNHRPK
jgi:hypothetical protein